MKVRFYTPAEVAEARPELLDEQGSRCAICEKPILRGVPDHCHKNGVIRGLLCNQCNTGLGMFRDSVDVLLAAITYLRRADQLIAEASADTESAEAKRIGRSRLAWQRRRAERYAKTGRTAEFEK